MKKSENPMRTMPFPALEKVSLIQYSLYEKHIQRISLLVVKSVGDLIADEPGV